MLGKRHYTGISTVISAVLVVAALIIGVVIGALALGGLGRGEGVTVIETRVQTLTATVERTIT
ncbi:hypothetical protein KEJ27_10550, partial [Candidatus Bathyarchaeota archaeon]|nr:hypothetical protein [Candidatus Bathyarchaeota archaeon]